VLESGKRYTLVVGADLLDADGRKLGRDFRKSFRTCAPVRSRVAVEDWKVRVPAAGTRDALVLTFPRPLDRALLGRMLVVVDEVGRPVAGRIEPGDEDRAWSFVPEQPWRGEPYSVRVDGQLEDLAGNTPLRVFDRKLDEPEPAVPPRLTVPFRPASR
jgi:hypothetical protein